MSAALQSSATALVDVSAGSVVRAILEANASVVLWLQWLVLQVLQTTRASTSTGADLNSWMADFGLDRLPPVAATGTVTFSRFATNLLALVPAGSVVKTADGALSYLVVEDSALSIWQSGSQGYVIPSGVASADLPIRCMTGGIVGNVLAQMVNVIASSLPGIDQVSNSNPLTDGTDAETDQELRNRFQGFLASRSRATLGAVRNAIAGVRQGLDIAIGENTAVGGSARIGSFLIIVDDGTGYPADDLLSAIASAVDSVRPIGTAFSVIAPKVLTASVSLTVAFASATDQTTGIANIQAQVVTYLNGLAIGNAASITGLAQRVYQVGSEILNIKDVQINGNGFDLIPPPLTVIKAGQIMVSIDEG